MSQDSEVKAKGVEGEGKLGLFEGFVARRRCGYGRKAIGIVTATQEERRQCCYNQLQSATLREEEGEETRNLGLAWIANWLQ